MSNISKVELVTPTHQLPLTIFLTISTQTCLKDIQLKEVLQIGEKWVFLKDLNNQLSQMKLKRKWVLGEELDLDLQDGFTILNNVWSKIAVSN